MTISTIIAIVLLGHLHFQISCRAELVYESEFKDDGRTVLLGGLFPIHASNGTGICGDILYESKVQRVESMVCTINTINDDRELLPKIKLVFSIRDTCTDPSYALEQAFQYVQPRSSNLTCISSSSDRVAVSGIVGAELSQVSIDIAICLDSIGFPKSVLFLQLTYLEIEQDLTTSLEQYLQIHCKPEPLLTSLSYSIGLLSSCSTLTMHMVM